MENVQMDEVMEVASHIALIDDNDKLTLVLLKNKLNEIINFINAPQSSVTRNRGPKSLRDMTEDDARRIMLGDLADVSHTECAQILGLSYGQIYSARKGYTQKPIYKEMKQLEKNPLYKAAE